MTEIKELINKEARELAGLLQKIIDKADQIANLYPHLDKTVKGVEYLELSRLISLFENHDIESLQQTLLYLTLERIEGRLYLAWNGRYRLNNACGIEFTCGSSIEIFITDRDSDDYGWNIGRVEYQEAMGGYYFLNESGWENHRLEEGMKVAVRKRAY